MKTKDSTIRVLTAILVLEFLLIFPVGFFEGGDGGDWDGIGDSGSYGEIGFPYRWQFFSDARATAYFEPMTLNEESPLGTWTWVYRFGDFVELTGEFGVDEAVDQVIIIG